MITAFTVSKVKWW